MSIVNWNRLIILSGIVVAIFVAASLALFVWPASDRPQHVAAVLSLNGANEPARERQAISLVEDGYAHVLLFSQGAYRNTPCPSVPRVVVVCFEPNPARTVGEVEFAASYARSHGWDSLMIVPGRSQTTRARLLMKRCFAGRVLVVPAPANWLHLPIEVAYEWGALVKALVIDRHC